MSPRQTRGTHASIGESKGFRVRLAGCTMTEISRPEKVKLTQLYRKIQVRAAVALLLAACLSACTPLYTSDTYIRSTPRAHSLVHNVSSDPVAALGAIAPANLQGFSPSLSLSL